MHRRGPNSLEDSVSATARWWPHVSTQAVPSPACSLKYALAPAFTADPAREDRPFRAELVERVRREIAEGRYETPEKLHIALERLLSQFAQP